MGSARPATPDDVDRLAELSAEGVTAQRPNRGGELWSRREARPLPAGPTLARALEDPDHLVLAGEYAGAVVGYAVARRERLRDGSDLAVVDDLYVEPLAREMAVGEALMDAVVAWARGLGCVGVDALALPGDRATKNFFEGFGLVARAIVVHRSLGPEPEPA